MLNMSTVLANHRWATKQSIREFAKVLGLAPATLMRVEQGYQPDGNTVAKVVRWLFDENEEPARRSPAHAKRGAK